MKQKKPLPWTGVVYENRKGDKYYAQAGTTKVGNPKYYLGRKITGAPVKCLPEGYEIYESPATAIAVLRKAKPTVILPEERRLVEQQSRALSGVQRLIVDVEPDAVVVYIPGMSDATAEDLTRLLGSRMVSNEGVKDVLISRSIYSPMLRFCLDDAEDRLFAVQRWCFRGAVDGWMFLDLPRTLAEQVSKFAPHLGKESFYELI